MADTDRPTTVEGYAAFHLRRQILGIADRVDDLANAVRRIADDVDKVGERGRDNYAQVVGRVVNEVGITLMNLSLGSLSTSAVTADIARAKGE